jgi:hypothetical protein
MIDDQKRVHTRMLVVAQEGIYKATFEQPVVEDRAAKQYVTVSKLEQNELLVDGVALDAAAPVERGFKTISITTPGLKFEAGSGVITINGQAVTVRLGEIGAKKQAATR